MSRSFARVVAFAALLGVFGAAGTANATHSWGGYHWSRAANPFTVTFSNNLTSNWSSYLSTAASDWSLTSGACNNPQNPVRATVVAGGGAGRKCRPTAGRVEVCNAAYGNNGWLGIASIWLSGTHITQGTVKVNDTYFNTAQYNTPAWRSAVMDQETGHTLGLDHQDVDFNNPDLLDGCGRGSCMDYSADPSNNTTPNQHDYDELVIIYNHVDAFAPVLNAAIPSDNGQDEENQSDWGQPVRFSNGRPITFEKEIGGGNKRVTFVLWAQ